MIFGTLEESVVVIIANFALVDFVGTEDVLILVFHEQKEMVVHFANTQTFH